MPFSAKYAFDFINAVFNPRNYGSEDGNKRVSTLRHDRGNRPKTECILKSVVKRLYDIGVQPNTDVVKNRAVYDSVIHTFE